MTNCFVLYYIFGLILYSSYVELCRVKTCWRSGRLHSIWDSFHTNSWSPFYVITVVVVGRVWDVATSVAVCMELPSAAERDTKRGLHVNFGYKNIDEMAKMDEL